MRKDWTRRPGVWCALGVFVLALAVYIRTMARTTCFWDCGEYITVAHTLGVPHQPGTPLYVLVGRCFDLLFFFLSSAQALNFMSAFFGALGVMITYLIVVDVARRADPDSGWLAHAGGLVGAIFLLFSDTYWNNSIEAEVYGLSGFVVALLTWLALRWYDARKEARSEGVFYLILYLLALGVGFHLGALLVYPGIFLLAFLARDRRLPLVDLLIVSAGLALFLFSTTTKNNGLLLLLLFGYAACVMLRAFAGRRFALIGSGLFVLGITVHAYLLIRAGHDPFLNNTQPDNLKTLLSVLRREQYPPLDPFVRNAPLQWQIAYYYNFLIRQFSFLGDGSSALARVGVFVGPLFLGLLGIFHGVRRARPWIWMLVAGYFINADVLNLYLNFTNHEVRERDYFYSTGFLYAAMLIGLGAAALLRYAAGPEGKSARDLPAGRSAASVRTGALPKATAGLLLLIALLPLAPGHLKWFQHDRSRNQIAREYAWNILAGLDRNAILFTNGDNDTYPVWYLQQVEGFRRDVTVVQLALVNLPWYVKQLRRHDPNLPLTFTDPQIDQLEARIYQDPRTGAQQVVYVRDYVVHDILTANRKRVTPRPAYYAVTVPQENMALYFPYLKMEGLAFRLMNEQQPDAVPSVDGERTLQNMLGIYDYRSLMTGDTPARQRAYLAEVGKAPGAGDAGAAQRLGAALPPAIATRLDYDPLVVMLGENRRDVWRDLNSSNLLGNYPAAAVRAGYDFLLQAQAESVTDTLQYDRLMDRALAAFELGQRFDPYFRSVGSMYPLLLVERGRTRDALAFLTGYLDGFNGQRPRPQEAEEAMGKALVAMADAGQAPAAIGFLEQRITTVPRDPAAYRTLFKVHRLLGDAAACRRTYDRWRAASGTGDPDMEREMPRLGDGPMPPATGSPGAKPEAR